jgi:hypothetical protein
MRKGFVVPMKLGDNLSKRFGPSIDNMIKKIDLRCRFLLCWNFCDSP